MDTTTRNTIALALETPEDSSLWQGLLRSQGLRTVDFDPRLGMADCAAAVADVPALRSRGTPPAEAARALATTHAGLPLMVRLPGRAGISKAEREWAQARGIASLLPGGTVAAWRESIVPMVERILSVAERPGLDAESLEGHVKDLVRRGIEPRTGPVKTLYADAFLLESHRLEPFGLLHAMQAADGVEVQDRTYRGKRYADCFVASEAVDWLEQRLKLRREIAEAACRFLWRARRIHHVVREAPFSDDFLFFRFGAGRDTLARVDLAALEDEMHARGGPEVADRTWRGRTFPKCFVGSDAVAWIMRRERVSFGAAESLGQSLLELGAFHHVADEHDFMGEGYFYRMACDERALAEALPA